MKNQDTKRIQEIIENFHARRFTGKIRRDVHLWLISPEDYAAKDEAMNEIWHNIPNSTTNPAYRSLGEVKAKLEMAPARKKTVALNRMAAKVAAVLIPAMLAVGAYFTYDGTGHPQWLRMDVPYGQTGHYILADGSNVWLNAGSTLIYPETFRGRLREVKLTGEGFFDVAANKRKPFVVHTAHMRTEVVGTSFNVSCYDNVEHESVTVLTGQVNVTTSDDKTHALTPDRHLTHWRVDGMTDVENVDASSMICWREDGLIFENNTFEDMLCALQRKYRIRVMADPAIFTDTAFRIWFVNGEPLEYIMEVIHRLAGLPYTFEDGVLTVGDGKGKIEEFGI